MERTKRLRRRVRAVALGAVLVAAVAGCGGSGLISRSDAIQNVVNAIDNGPTWETREMSEAVSGWLKFRDSNDGNDGGGGCAWRDGVDAENGFVCYLEGNAPTDPQADPSTGMVKVYFNQAGDGSHITPIDAATYTKELALSPIGATSSSPKGGTRAAKVPASSHPTTTSASGSVPNIGCPAGDTQSGYGCLYQGHDPAANPSGQVNPTHCPRRMTSADGGCMTSSSSGTPAVVGGFSGVAPASASGPATGQAACPGVAASVAADTSCPFAANVLGVVKRAYHATGSLPAHITADSPVTNRIYSLDCNTANPSTDGTPSELECTAGTAEITIDLPLR